MDAPPRFDRVTFSPLRPAAQWTRESVAAPARSSLSSFSSSSSVSAPAASNSPSSSPDSTRAALSAPSTATTSPGPTPGGSLRPTPQPTPQLIPQASGPVSQALRLGTTVNTTSAMTSASAPTTHAPAPGRAVSIRLPPGRPAAAVLRELADPAGGFAALAISHPVPAVAARPPDFRQRHPVLTICANAAVRDCIGQTLGRTFYVLAYPLMASALFNEDLDKQWLRRVLMLVIGGVVAIAIAALAGRRTAQKLSAVVHPTSLRAHRQSRLHTLGLIPPLTTLTGIGLSGLFFGLRGASLTAANSIARILQFYGRDSGGQTWVSRTRYDPDGYFPGYGLVVHGPDGRALTEADPDAARRFQNLRVAVATGLYLGLCIATYASVPSLQSELFDRDPHDVSLEAFAGGNLGAVLASIALEIADAVTGVLAFPIAACARGFTLSLNTAQAPFDLPRAILHNGHARLAFNALHEVFSPLIERFPHPVIGVALRTVAQTATEPRGFVDATGRSILDRWAREAQEAAQARAQALERAPEGSELSDLDEPAAKD